MQNKSPHTQDHLKNKSSLRPEEKKQKWIRQTQRDRSQNYDIDGVSMDEAGVILSTEEHGISPEDKKQGQKSIK